MILIITNKEDVTADYLCQNYLASESYLRIDTDDLHAIEVHFDEGQFSLSHSRGKIEPSLITGVWYRRPGRLVPPVAHSESAVNQLIVEEWTEAIEGFLEEIPFSRWVNHPCANIRASRKLHQLRVAVRANLHVPATRLTMSSTEARHHMERHGRLVTKPLGTGMLLRETGITQIYTSEVSGSALGADMQFGCPTLYQERIQKRVDVRVTVVDTEMVAVAISSPDACGEQTLDIRQGMTTSAQYSKIDIPGDVARGIREIMAFYRLRFGALDFAIDHQGRWVFFEINPNGQWAWLDFEAGLHIGQALAVNLAAKEI